MEKKEKEKIEDAFVRALESSRIKDIARQKEHRDRRKAAKDAHYERMKEKRKERY